MNATRRQLFAPAVVASVLGIGLVRGRLGRAQDATPAAEPAASPAASPIGSPAASPVATGSTVVLEGFDIGWSYEGRRSAPGAPVDLTVAPGTTISLPNAGAIAHNFVVDALDLYADMPAGQTVEVTIPADAAPGAYEYYCSIPGHKPAGMVGTLTIG